MKKSVMHTLGKAAAVLLACLITLQMPVSVAAEETTTSEGTSESDTTSEDTTPRATFTNDPSTSPDLYVTKDVVGTDDTDTSFTFVLTVDGKAYGNEIYSVTDASGQAVSAGTDQSGASLTWQTGRDGSFTLKAGQTAKFEYVGEGRSYQVTENSLPDNYQAESPANGIATGTVAAGSTHVHIRNRYVIPDNPEQETTDLVVANVTTFPEGYVIPDNPDFTFEVSLDGEALANQMYYFEDLSGNNLRSGTTDENGHFTLKGNQLARFAGVSANLDFSAKELTDSGFMPENWRAVGYTDADHEYHSVYDADGAMAQMLVEGATRAPETRVSFFNACASFIVTKRMRGGTTPDQKFTFTLSNSAGKLWPNARYYLYDSRNALAETGIQTTDAQGQFALKAGQKAVFVGISTGTTYSVKEQAAMGYMQVTPTETSGYQDKVIGDSVEELPFVNQPAPSTQHLKVTMKVNNLEDQAASADQEFILVLKKKDSSGNYQLAANTVYTIQKGLDTLSLNTDESGRFRLKADQTAFFETVETGDYKVEELNDGLTQEYSLNATESILSGTLVQNDVLSLLVVNDYRPKLLNIEITKQALGGTKLAGAGFKLYTAENLDSSASYGGDAPYLTGTDGTITIEGLVSGTYWLKEVQAPDDYMLSDRVYCIEITRGTGENAGDVNVKIDDNDVPLSLDLATAKDNPYVTTDDDGLETVHLTIINSKIPILPKTGGIGIFLIVLAAVAAGIVGIILRISATHRNSGRKNQ